MTRARSLRPAWLLLALLAAVAPFALLQWFPVRSPSHAPHAARALTQPAATPGPRFRRVPAIESGLVFRNELRPENRYTYLTNGAGLAVGDYDQDGLPDLYLVSQDGPNRLYKQTAPMRFQDVTQAAGRVDGGEAWGSSACFVDVDADGWLDLYVCNTEAKNLLYRNRGDGTFEECAARFGLDLAAASTMAAFADADGDGDLDVYVATNRALHAGWALTPQVLAGMKAPAATRRPVAQMVPAGSDTASEAFQRLQRGETAPGLEMPEALREHFFAFHGRVYMAGQRDVYLRNDGGRFVDATKAAGFADHGMGLSVSWFDYDQDGRPDLYVANDLESPDQLWHNEGNGRFRLVTRELLPHTAYYGMGSDSGDVDGDGRLDLFVGDMSATTHRMAKILMGDMNAQRDFLIHGDPQQYMRNALLLNTGTSRFQEVAFLAGVASTDWTWSTLFGDLDNDARLDLYCTNGIARFDMNPDLALETQALWRAGRESEAIARIQNVPAVPEKNLALRNAGDLHFVRTGADWGLDAATISHGAVLCDLDRDGDLDVVTNDFGEECGLYENRTADGNSLAFVLRQADGNTHALGARVDLVLPDGKRLVRENWSARGYLSGQEPRLHFGLGVHPTAREVVVRWPSGSVQVLADLEAGREYELREPLPRASATIATSAEPTPMLEERAEGIPFTHSERAFDDYRDQFLLPHALSQLGPGLAFADADGDGDEDVFVGNGAGEPGVLFRNEYGRFRAVPGPWQDDAGSEDLGVLWLDHDGDGDLDLFVVSGGVEANEGDVRQRDRLYRNDGGLQFVRDEAALPDLRESGSSAACADVDGDGDLDLVVGGRLVPGRFPDAPPTRVLRNDGGRFVDATDSFAPSLRNAGMVTSVVLAPIDGDRWPDLLVAAQWQPLRFLRNREGKGFDDATEAAGLAATSGQWNSLVPVDVDGDGDLDFVAGNLGRNTKYKASVDHPLGLVFADFDDNGSRDLVETKYEGDRLLPVRGRSCSSQAMPFVAEKFPTYAQFAGSVLGEIYPEQKLATAGRLSCARLDSVLLRNDGTGRFVVESLTTRAQVAPLFSGTAIDVDGDGRLEVVFGTNFFSPEPETGHFDGGIGLCLSLPDLVVVEPSRSGFVAFGDHKGLAAADLDGDGHPEFVVAQNEGRLRVFGARAPKPGTTVRLDGSKGNPTGVGARVTAIRRDGSRDVRTVVAGSGYLSQDSAALWFADGASPPTAFEVEFVDGERVRVEARSEGHRVLRIAHPTKQR